MDAWNESRGEDVRERERAAREAGPGWIPDNDNPTFRDPRITAVNPPPLGNRVNADVGDCVLVDVGDGKINPGTVIALVDECLDVEWNGGTLVHRFRRWDGRLVDAAREATPSLTGQDVGAITSGVEHALYLTVGDRLTPEEILKVADGVRFEVQRMLDGRSVGADETGGF